MSKIGEELLLALNQLMPDHHQELLLAKHDPLAYMKFFESRSASSFTIFEDLDLNGKEVLDVGCGLGANLAYLHQNGAKQVTGLDISHEQIRPTRSNFKEQYPQYATRTHFVTADAARMPFPDNRFDVLVAADTFEHIDDLHGALQDCLRVIRPSGRLYVYFPPFYAPWGAHMVNWIRLPWCQVLFGEATLVNTARRLEREGKAMNSKLPAETQLDLEEGDTIPFVSHLTVGRFERAVADLPGWQIVQRKLLSLNWRSSSWQSQLLRPLTYLPILQEYFTAKAAFVLQKRNQSNKETLPGGIH